MTLSPISESELQAYADGQLDEARRCAVERHLAAHPEAAERVAAYLELNRALHAQFDPILEEAVPQRLSDILNQAPRPGWRQRLRTWAASLAPVIPWPGLSWSNSPWLARSAMPYAAAVLWLGLGATLGWQLKGQAPLGAMPPMVRHAAVAYATYAGEVRHPVEVQADQEAHLVAWLSKRLGIPLKAVRLNGAGFHLMGGRLLAGTQGPVAQFMYEDAGGQRLTLYIKAQERGRDQNTAFRFAREDGVDSFFWIDAGTGYVLSGNLSKADLLRAAQLVYEQLEAPAPAAAPAREGGAPTMPAVPGKTAT